MNDMEAGSATLAATLAKVVGADRVDLILRDALNMVHELGEQAAIYDAATGEKAIAQRQLAAIEALKVVYEFACDALSDDRTKAMNVAILLNDIGLALHGAASTRGPADYKPPHELLTYTGLGASEGDGASVWRQAARPAFYGGALALAINLTGTKASEADRLVAAGFGVERTTVTTWRNRPRPEIASRVAEMAGWFVSELQRGESVEALTEKVVKASRTQK